MMLRLGGRTEEAARGYQRALAVGPEHAPAQTNLASILCERSRHREAMRAYRAAVSERAVQLTAERDDSALDSLAAAYAAIERFDRATTVAARAWRLTSAAG